ncbi:MAG: hypothetical protein ACRDT6_22535 [Micromonosporaceae bacterium]
MYLAHENPAGGAPLLQVVLTTLIALTFLAPTVLVVLAERTGRPTVVGRWADAVAARTGLPRWFGLPVAAQVASLLSAGVGVYWDVPYHVDFGRDEGPLANPAHYLILFGLLGVFASGLLSIGLAGSELPRRTVRVMPGLWGRPGWDAPVGGVLITVAGAFGLLGFPLDDAWHRVFGQDVTEWGPTHVLMIGGAVLSILGTAVLSAEARQLGTPATALRWVNWNLALWWLLGISAFLMEYDLGVPQFPMVAQVAITAIAATWALTWARVAYGPGGAVLAAVAFLALRGVLTLLVIGVVDRTPHHFSFYLAEAVLIELLALVLSTERRYQFGAVAGIAVGSLGMVAEWGWTALFLPLPWPAAELPRYLVYGVLAGIGGGLLGAWQLQKLESIAADRPSVAPLGWRRTAVLALGAVLAFGTLGVSVPRTYDDTIRGELTLTPATTGYGDSAVVTVKLDEAVAADATWFYALAWQGGGSVKTPMERVSPGVYRSADPLPVNGEWKTLVRLHTGPNHLVSLPVYFPEDKAIPVAAIPAESGVTRSFTGELPLLQREAKVDLAPALWNAGYGILFAIYLVLFGVITALYVRAASARPGIRANGPEAGRGGAGAERGSAPARDPRPGGTASRREVRV